MVQRSMMSGDSWVVPSPASDAGVAGEYGDDDAGATGAVGDVDGPVLLTLDERAELVRAAFIAPVNVCTP